MRKRRKVVLAFLAISLSSFFLFAPVIHPGTQLAPRQVWISLCNHSTCACIIFGCYTGDSWSSISYYMFGMGEYYIALRPYAIWYFVL
jgi:hypothetical protein